ncbi:MULTISPECIES: tautomerase family protein [Lysobacteraceae]|uniref:4-oxalocrotonate tautomerase family protein n=2 Tax=Lysobacteraceae TaxID=32033 RepID=A0A514BSK1_9GAMM|nr:4-oxalocrotonate tautomerase family protein [Lysobacter alkalisoli]QDH70361.1 4-oxalocrotonate tautomerase family protein [Lysobacter alkalisoli]
MPILNVKVAAVRSQALSKAIASLLQDLTARVLRKDPAVTAIAIDFVAPEDWYAGGRSLAEQRKSSVYFDIKVTDETNTKDEKAEFIREAFSGLAALLGNLHEESYIHVHDVRAAAYGYGGVTQEARYHQRG